MCPQWSAALHCNHASPPSPLSTHLATDRHLCPSGLWEDDSGGVDAPPVHRVRHVSGRRGSFKAPEIVSMELPQLVNQRLDV